MRSRVTPRIRYCEAYVQRIPGFSKKICDLGHKIIDLYLRRFILGFEVGA
jgi:hypothetical protein